MKKLKKMMALALSVAMAVSLTACGGSSTASTTAAPAETTAAPAATTAAPAETKAAESTAAAAENQAAASGEYDIANATYVLKAGHVLAEGHPYHQTLLWMDQQLAEKTNGDLRIEVYPNSQLGNERDLQEGCSLGTVDIGIGATATLSNFTTDFALFDLPYLFASKDEARKVLHSDWAKKKLSELESLDMIGLTFWEAGMFDVIQDAKSVKEIADFEGLTIRVMENDIFMATMTALGINPVPMAWSEVFTSIQNKTVDGTSNPIATIYANKIYTIAHHFTIANMIYSPIPVIMAKSTYDRLPAEYQQLMYEVAEEAAFVEYDKIDELEKEGLKGFEEEGVEVVYFTDDQIAECQNIMVEKVWPQFVGGKVAQEDIDAINEIKAQ